VHPARVLVLVPFPLAEEGVAQRRAQTATAALGSDVTLEYRAVRAGPTSFMSPHDWLLMDVALLEAGLPAQEEGYDAVLVDTVSDSGIEALRSMLDIPVIGPGKAALLFALTLGSRFGVLAQWAPSLARWRKALDEWHLEGQCAAVEHFDTPPDFSALIAGKEQEVFPKMEAACRRLLESGADVICLGSTTMHQSGAYLQQRLPVPVVNPGPLSYRLIHTLLALGVSHSRVTYPRPLVPKPGLLHAMLEAAASADGSAIGP
jgi:allantoin racemase